MSEICYIKTDGQTHKGKTAYSLLLYSRGLINFSFDRLSSCLNLFVPVPDERKNIFTIWKKVPRSPVHNFK